MTRLNFGMPRRIPTSIEATATQLLDKVDITGLFPTGTRVYLTDVGTDSAARLVAAARHIHDCGYVPVPHIPARRLTGINDLEHRIASFTGEAGVTEALVVAGSPDRQQGPFASSMDVLQTGMLDRHGFTWIGVAGHPEGSPDISERDIAAAIRQKNDFARETNAEMALVTQFAFNAETMITWAEKLTAEGNTLPVHLGLAGPAKLTTLLKYAAMCGVGASLGFLKKRAGAIAALTTSYSPDQMMDPIETYWQANPDGPVAQVHVFPFGGLKKTAEYLTERGNWFDAPVADNNNDPAQQEVMQ